MDIRFALKRQNHATLYMLRECVELASDEIWLSGKHPRNLWRIAYHACFYAHLYLVQEESKMVPWDKHRETATDLWDDANPPVIEPYTRAEIMDYIKHIDDMVDEVIDHLDLEREDTGFHWYKDMSKLEHEILCIRHVQTHVGQLSQLLMDAGIDGFFWSSKGPKPAAT